MRVGVIGAGVVGRPVIEALRCGEIHGAALGGVLTRHGAAGQATTLGELVRHSDLVVEAAGQNAVREHGLTVVRSNRDLLVVSVGALADDHLLADLRQGPGRMQLCAGAVGGVELLRAATAAGGLTSVRLTTRKSPRALGLKASGDPAVTEVFNGTAREAARRFPENLNVAATVALATVGLDRTQVTLVSDPRAKLTTHVIEASGTAGTYRFEIANNPSPARPATSAIVPHAVIEAVRSLVHGGFRPCGR